MEEATMDSATAAAAHAVETDDTRPIRWYSRSALEKYLAEADRERARLQATLDDANIRHARASSAVGLHQTMMEMLLDSQRQVGEIRRTAEARAAQIMADGEREAEAILRAAGSGPATNGSRPQPAAEFTPSPAATDASTGNGSASARSDAEFFSYLKGALAEDEPLGPLPQ